MAKITFMGAGSSVFAKRVLGDCMMTESLRDAHIALYDIDATRLKESHKIIDTLNENINKGRATVTTHCGVRSRRAALRNADYVINAIQVGRYKPSTVIDFEVPKKYGLRQTIADTLGIGGIFRSLRTIPVMLEFAADMEAVCPNAWFLNYTNPMVALSTAMNRATGIRTVGLCHSVQVCAPKLLEMVGLDIEDYPRLKHLIAGINHQGWLLEISHDGKDLYPDIKKRAFKMNDQGRKNPDKRHDDMVRFEIMRHFGYYLTESSEHSAEYMPWFIKASRPELIDELNIPLDEYPRRCEQQIEKWATLSKELVDNPNIEHERTHEYASRIMDAMETDVPFRFGGNVLNRNIITNLPTDVCVEVTCIADRNGVTPLVVGDLPPQCAALNRTNINVHLMVVEAALTGRRDHVYQAAMLDPHTAAELTLDQIRDLCDDLIEAHGDMLPSLS